MKETDTELKKLCFPKNQCFFNCADFFFFLLLNLVNLLLCLLDLMNLLSHVAEPNEPAFVFG